MALPISSSIAPCETDHPRQHEHSPASEAREALLGLAGRRFSPLPAELIVDHIVQIYPYDAAGWRVQRAALDAVLRRFRFAAQDDLTVARRPRGGLGVYTCRRGRGRRARPYETLLVSVSPLDASCDCPDFLRGGLGICKHVLTVLDDLARKERLERLVQPSVAGGPGMRNGHATGDGRPRVVPRLTWDPVRPLIGNGDALAAVRLLSRRRPGPRLARHLTPGGEDEPGLQRKARGVRGGSGGIGEAQAGRASDGPPDLKDDTWVVKERHLERPDRRFEVLAELSTWARRNPHATDPAVRALIRDEQERMERAANGKAASKKLRSALRTMRRRLYPYQVEGVTRLFECGRLLLADDMGLGKTAQAVGACHALLRTRRVRRGLVVVPASLRIQWEREWYSFTDAPVRIIDGSPDARREIYGSTQRGFLITSYDHLMRDLALILEWSPEVVILDEAQKIKNWATKTAGSVKRIKSPYRLVLTGTPLENRLDELASIMDWVDDRSIEPKWRLTPWHTTTGDGGKEVIGARNLDTLRGRLAPVMVRRRRPEVIAQLPPRTDTVIPVPITEAQAFEHDGYSQPIIRLMRIAQKRPLTQAEFLRLMQLFTMQRIIANGLAQRDFEDVWPSVRSVSRPDEALLSTLNAPKLLELRALVERVAVEQERKIIIFSEWRRMLALASWATAPILDDAGVRAVFFTGAESQKRRMENVVDLHEDPDVRVLFASDAGGLGLNLQRASSCCINLDLPWNPAVLEQRIGRIYRLGQTDPIDVYNLVSEGSIEERIAGIISDKKALFSGLFDGDSNEVSFDRSATFLSQLEKLVDPPELAVSDDDGDEDVLEVVGDALTDGADDMPAIDGEEPAAGEEQRREADGEAARETSGATAEEQDTGHGEPSKDGIVRGPPDMDRAGAEPSAVEQASEGERASAPAAAADAMPLPDPAKVRSAFVGLAVERTSSGGLRIEAEPEAAETLGALLEGLGRLMREAAGSS